jgi:hypothetical protein
MENQEKIKIKNDYLLTMTVPVTDDRNGLLPWCLHFPFSPYVTEDMEMPTLRHIENLLIILQYPVS